MSFQTVRIEGRAGPQRSEFTFGAIDYDPLTQTYRLCIDDRNNPEFWIHIAITQTALDAAKAQGEMEQDDDDDDDN